MFVKMRLSRSSLCVCLFAYFLIVAGNVCAQDKNHSTTVASIEIGTFKVAPKIDGKIEESEWAGSVIIDQPFIQFQPNYGSPSQFRTVVRIAQTNDTLYIAFEAFDADIEQLASSQTQRDSHLGRDDSVAVLLDTFHDQRTAYGFQTNALGTQRDFRIADNGRTTDDRWDAAWRSVAQRLDDRWVVEMEIPFAILKFVTEDEESWGLNILRTVPRRREYAFWSEPSEAFYRVSSFGELHGVQPPAAGDAWQFIPYTLVSYENGKDGDFQAGGDIRWRPSNRFGVDLTLNPDFALVEADVEKINLSRFELRISEKRPFFLEGNEMYKQRIEQFYSRRIGDITWGAKTNGKLKQTDFSAIATSADINRASGQGSDRADYAVLRLQQGFGNGSNIGLLAANRSYLDDNSGSAGFDTTLFFTDTLGMTAQLLSVHGPSSDNGLAWFLRPSWDSVNSHFHIRYANLDKGIKDDFNAVGFLRDDDRKEWDTNLSHKFWFDSGVFEQIETSVNYNRYTSQQGLLRSWDLDAEVEFNFRNGWEIELSHSEEFKLFEKEFRNDYTGVELGWDSRDGRQIYAWAGKGINYDSDLLLYGAGVRWLIGDKWRFEYDLTRLELDPDPEQESTTIHVFEALYAFNTDMYAKVFLQTNSEISKQNVQALWVWRIRPPFGSLQLAYQRGTSEQGQEFEQDDTIFTKFSWVF
jgi:hypothetical protein